jgi:cytoskeletal protein RodZ
MTSKLKETREKAGYTIEQVAAILKIRKQYVIDLEEENFRDIPGKIYVNGYTKIYHEFLGLEQDDDNDHTIVRPRESKAVSIVKQKLILLTSSLMLIVVVGIYSFLKN